MSFILDSGAYSAANSGKPLSLDAYMGFCFDNQSWLTHYIALDVVTTHDPEIGASMSYTNYERMLKHGLRPIPVFHFGEDIKWLERILETEPSYIALGGTAVLSSKQKSMEWYSAAWARLVDPQGYAAIKVHAFGETDEGILNSFPWQSADSATWMHVLRTKSIIIQNRRRAASTLSAMDMETLLARFTRATAEEFNSVGKLGRVLQTYLTALHYLDLQSRIRQKQASIRYRPHGFFQAMAGDRQRIQLDPFALYLSISGFPEGAAALDALDHPSLLGSFFYYQPEWLRLVREPRSFAREHAPYKEYCDLLKAYLHA